MRVVYRNFWGKRVEKRFNSWGSMCGWLKRWHLVRAAVNEIREVREEVERM